MGKGYGWEGGPDGKGSNAMSGAHDRVAMVDQKSWPREPRS